MNLPPYAQAQIKDRTLTVQYEALLTQLKERFREHTALRDLDTQALVEEFEKEALETPETRELLNRLEALSHDPRQVEPYIQQLHEWGKRVAEIRQTSWKQIVDEGTYEFIQWCAVTGGGIYWTVFSLFAVPFPLTLIPNVCHRDENGITCPDGFTPQLFENAYPYFTPSGKTLFWALEAIPLYPWVIFLGIRGVQFAHIKFTLAQAARMEKWQNQLLADLTQATGIPALKEISQALASALDNQETAQELTEVVVDSMNWGEGAFLPAL